ncbi:E3 ubiquitin-protein ligase PDZRN3-like isoform X1 [Centruroides sculpturatus]|uniref:E3 ubiquitin-protein ligase PDZRN3-like isoform X1 n=2 Tax=Centruroides sculpturatus TaxID=218467 RepID=UPI000C6E94A4|nr:E3 ubiquitin-protein ligase PDZRN3-like isoform X1 [Centruroides sculpturatus]
MEHNCVQSLKKLVQVQQQQIGNLERELRRLAVVFGQREDVLLTQISSLHKEIQRQMSSFHQLINKWQSTNRDTSTCSQVNGQDLSKASHEEAIEAFRQAKEPILVEVLRRSSPKPGMTESSHLQSPNCCDITTQTEWSGNWDPLLPLEQNNTMSQTTQLALLTSDHYVSLGSEPDGDDDGVEYEEVILQRSGSTEKLGLTLCYGAPEELETDIFVSEIEPESVAAKDGRIQKGDQLLQINGVEVCNREQAISLFSEKRQDFTLLVARPQMQMEDYLLEDQTSELPLAFCRQHLEDADDTDTGTAENQHEKDSGVGRTDDSTKNEESSEHEAAESVIEQQRNFQNDDCNDNNKLKTEEETSETKCFGPLCRFQSDISLDHEMALLNQEMENIQLECESLVNRHLQEQQRLRCQLEHVYVNLADLRTSNRFPDQETKLSMDKKESVERWVKSMVLDDKKTDESSSAYNTGDSRRSTPLTLELSPLPCEERNNEFHGSMISLISPKMEDKSTQLNESDVASIFSCDSCRKCCRALFQYEETSQKETTKTKKNNEEIRDESSRKRKCATVYPCTTMYTNQDNLQHTIWLQQQLFRQALVQQQSKQKKLPNCGSKRESIASKVGGLSTVKEDEEMKMEWKVKRRSDGTRYITRRPARNRILRERAIKITEERSGLTTDDDAVSELKVGKYWSKEERKRHLERARDRKKKEMIMRTKMSCLKEYVEDGDEQNRKETNILELSYKKMMKKRGKAVFDDFTTVQEVLVHGTKGQSSGTKPLGLLSVTTV